MALRPQVDHPTVRVVFQRIHLRLVPVRLQLLWDSRLRVLVHHLRQGNQAMELEHFPPIWAVQPLPASPPLLVNHPMELPLPAALPWVQVIHL